jgi:hypothetical protein
MDLVGYHEKSEETRLDEVAFSHMSIEVGHFYLTDLAKDIAGVEADFKRIAPLVGPFIDSARVQFGTNNIRASTCYLLDDYFQRSLPPDTVIGKLLTAAAAGGVNIDYLVRESGCWESQTLRHGAAVGDRIRVAEMVAARIVEEPALEATGIDEPGLMWRPMGTRKSTAESGWLCNGKRSSEYSQHDALDLKEYEPPEEYGKREHSIFLDVELWNRITGSDGVTTTRWSCPFLASVWQLLRLGMLRHQGRNVVEPELWPAGADWPDTWDALPTVIKLNRDAAPFQAFKTLSMLPKRFLAIEHAVRLILDHIHLDEDVVAQVAALGQAEGIEVSHPVTERVSHLLFDGS